MSQLRASAPTLRRLRRSGRRRRRPRFPLALALALVAQLEARAVASVPQPPPGFDLGALITGWFQRHGLVGSLALVALALVWALLSQAQNIESAKRLLGWDQQPEKSPLDPRNPTHIPHNLPQASDSAVPLVGRDASLARLGQLLETGNAPVWITGMHGVGKTALALHHLHQRLEDYGGGVVMLDGQRLLTGLVEQLEQFALVHFDQQVPEELPTEGRLAWLYSHWPLPGPVLLLVDELRDPADLQAMGRGLPERFRLLVTSQRQLGTVSQRVPLEPLEAEQAVALLAEASERGPFPEGEKRWARALAREVGGLPLALWLLGRRLARDGDLELAELERRLRQKGALARDLQPNPADPLQARGLRAGFQLAWEGSGEAERELALLLGELPPAAIPWEPLALSAPPALDSDDWREARLGLEQQHLVERPLAGLVVCHPLLHDLFAAQTREGDGAERRVRQIGGAGAAELEAGCLVALAGLALERGQWAEAQGRQALAVLEATGDGDDLDRAEALNGLGLTLAALAKPEAETVLREALDLRLKHLDGAHRLVRISRNNLAMCLRKLGRAAEAEALYLKVLATLHGDLGEATALETAPCEVSVTARNNLSFLAEDAGELERAHGLRKEAVALAALALGEDHPRRGLMLMSLGVVAEKLGRLAEAKDHYRRAVQLTEAAWGPDHPRSQDCRLTLEAFLAAPISDPADADH